MNFNKQEQILLIDTLEKAIDSYAIHTRVDKRSLRLLRQRFVKMDVIAKWWEFWK
jgi:hypothetical protein